jgi:hypothetical protein
MLLKSVSLTYCAEMKFRYPIQHCACHVCAMVICLNMQAMHINILHTTATGASKAKTLCLSLFESVRYRVNQTVVLIPLYIIFFNSIFNTFTDFLGAAKIRSGQNRHEWFV